MIEKSCDIVHVDFEQEVITKRKFLVWVKFPNNFYIFIQIVLYCVTCIKYLWTKSVICQSHVYI